MPGNEPVTFETLSACIHPEDLSRVRTAFTSTRRTVGVYEIDFCILHHDGIRWISARDSGPLKACGFATPGVEGMIGL